MNMYNRPDYGMYYQCFMKLMKNHKVKYTDKYDWETEEQAANLRRSASKQAQWENSKEFFDYDPLGIDCAPPSNKSSKSATTTTQEDVVVANLALQKK
uniref:Uncharacterized protein n=1 Tax=Panagrolaimus sp. JU765 TaxID=591449 RepID=A0AC34R3T3_9BILA